MCGIIGYTGHRPAVPLVIEGLRRLEYRGYDSSGVAFIQAGKLGGVKAAGKLSVLEERLAEKPNLIATTALGHTRWATHGVPADRNAHPHFSSDGSLALIHNGIIENYLELKEFLLGHGYTLVSETDTEILASLIAYERQHSASMRQAFEKALHKAKGAYALVMLAAEEPQTLYAARLSAPLLLGIGAGECFVASDIPAFLPYTRDVIFLEDYEFAIIESQGAHIFSLKNGKEIERAIHTIHWDMQIAQKEGFKHFMLKEIFEQPRVITDCLAGRLHEKVVCLPELNIWKQSPRPQHFTIVACGTSYHAGLWARPLLEQATGVPCTVEIASEFRYRDPLLCPDDLVILVSQSGETADTLAALHLAKAKGIRTLGICNVVGSSLAREADAVLYTQAGPEISVASTKALTSQMVVFALLAAYYAGQGGTTLFPDAALQLAFLDALTHLPVMLEKALPAMHTKAVVLAPVYSGARSFFFLGRGAAYPLALEGALKLKELSYIHAEGYAAGEMKHGPIALIDSEFPTFAIALDDILLPKVISNIQEVQARRGKVIVLTNTVVKTSSFAFEQLDTLHAAAPGVLAVDDVWQVPASHPLLAAFFVLPALQLFCYEIADYLGKDVDQPRNLAKSVTVE